MTQNVKAWQSQLAGYSLKKRVKFAVIVSVLGRLDGRECLEVGCGPGASGLVLESLGGRWLHADPEPERLVEAEGLLPGRTRLMAETGLADLLAESFDQIVAVDLMEHVREEPPLLADLFRLLRPGGRLLVTTPRLRPHSLPAMLRKVLGLRSEVFGHRRDGYTPGRLAELLTGAGFEVTGGQSFLGPVTSSLETCLDGAYYQFIGRRRERGQWSGGSQISPGTGDELKRHGAAFAAYRCVFPLLRLIGGIDRLLPRGKGYGILLSARKPGGKR